VYTRGSCTPGEFRAAYIPKADDVVDASAETIQTLQDQLAQKDKAAGKAESQLAETEAEVQRLLDEIAAIKAANEPTLPDEDFDEATTRDVFIDVMLREAGWDPKGRNVGEYEVRGMPTDKGVGYVDYVLWGQNGKPVGLVEAKRTKVDPRKGQRQAELYADCLQQMTGQRPVIFYTNGYETWIWDDTLYPPRTVQGFYTQDELQLMVNRRTSRKDLTQIPVNRDIAGRHYQEEAARWVTEAFAAEVKRKALIVMATGTGKTRLSISLVDMLMRANWVRRVLFLADRVALVNQAKRAFNSLLPHASLTNLSESKDDPNARVVFSTYPTMMNCIDGTQKDLSRQFSVGHFDLIIIDEAHRSVYQKYGAIFDYFDSLLLGLTATPKAEVDKNTYRLFELENHLPTFAYELREAVEDEYLVPPRALSVPVRFPREGIKYDELSPEEQEEYEEKFYDEETDQMPDEINAAALNNWLFNESTVDKVLKHVMERGQKVEGGDKLGKTIIFAKNHKHAQFIVEQFDKNYPHLTGKFCRVVDSSVKYVQSLIDDFSIKEKYPQIAVSVDMLDTGIDVPEIVNLSVLQDRSLENQVLADGGARDPAVRGLVRIRCAQGVLLHLRLLPEPGIFR
ncbi:MAG: DEAD/DEAH box helicase family protein, partial [Gammaproteobacteria bacterium]